MPKTMSGEHFVDIAEELHPKLHTGVEYQNDYMAEGAIGNGSTPAEEDTGAGKSEAGGGVERAGFETQGPEREGMSKKDSSKTSKPGNYEA
jgi:hypothetical protein